MSTSAMRQLLLLFMLIIYTSQLCEDKEEVFKPSDEWQEVKECQSIPPGLHVRINLQTGLKEAKLLTEADSDSNNKNGAIQVSDVVSEDKLFDQENIRKLSKDDLTMMLSKLKDESHPSEMTSQDSFNRSNELINEQFYTDTEIMYSLLELLVDTNITDEDVIFYLLELEFYVHQFDNAHNLHSLGGLSLVIRFLNHSNHLVRSTAALTIGSALQRYHSTV
jgi:nucleotide exchange factor SIL1